MSSAKTLEDNAGAIAFITWRLALEGAKNLNKEGFRYDSDKQRVRVISELLAFQIQLADRLTFERIGDAERDVFINALGLQIAEHMQDNMLDIAGPGNYRAPFIALLNDRLEDYSDLNFEDDSPGFDFLRYVGNQVLKVMGEDQTNRWVMDQVMSIEAPEIFDRLKKAVHDLFA